MAARLTASHRRPAANKTPPQRRHVHAGAGVSDWKLTASLDDDDDDQQWSRYSPWQRKDVVHASTSAICKNIVLSA